MNVTSTANLFAPRFRAARNTQYRYCTKPWSIMRYFREILGNVLNRI